MNRLFKFLFFFLSFLALRASFAHASPLNDFYIQQALERYFTLPQSAEVLASGGSTALSCADSQCIFFNPAGLGGLESYELAASIGTGKITGEEFLTADSIEQSEDRGYGVISIPLGKADGSGPEYGTLAIGYSRYTGNTNDSINTTPDGFRRSLAYGLSVTKDVSVGYAFHFYDDQLHSDVADLHSHSRLLHVFGTQLRLDETVVLGAEFQLGIGQSDTEDFQFGSNGLSHLRQYSGAMGVTKQFKDFETSIAVDYTHIKSRGNLAETTSGVVIGGDEGGEVFNIRVGAGIEPIDRLHLRTGFRWYQVVDYEFEQDGLEELSGNVSAPYWSAGLDYLIKFSDDQNPRLKLAYGFEYTPLGQGDWKHLVSLVFSFGT